MIEIGYTIQDGGVILDRELTENEINFTTKRVTADKVQFYYNDEPESILPQPDIEESDPLSDVDLMKIINRMTPDELLTLKNKLNELS